MQYQVQEMPRLEGLFEPETIQEELDVYNPLIPDGGNWKATFMIEYPDVEEHRRALACLIGIEDGVWVRVAGHDKVHAIANEDLDRRAPDKTASVHFPRFELTPEMRVSVKAGAATEAGIEHPACAVSVVADETTRISLAAVLA